MDNQGIVFSLMKEFNDWKLFVLYNLAHQKDEFKELEFKGISNFLSSTINYPQEFVKKKIIDLQDSYRRFKELIIGLRYELNTDNFLELLGANSTIEYYFFLISRCIVEILWYGEKYNITFNQ